MQQKGFENDSIQQLRKLLKQSVPVDCKAKFQQEMDSLQALNIMLNWILQMFSQMKHPVDQQFLTLYLQVVSMKISVCFEDDWEMCCCGGCLLRRKYQELLPPLGDQIGQLLKQDCKGKFKQLMQKFNASMKGLEMKDFSNLHRYVPLFLIVGTLQQQAYSSQLYEKIFDIFQLIKQPKLIPDWLQFINIINDWLKKTNKDIHVQSGAS